MKIIGIDSDARGCFCHTDFDKNIFSFHNIPAKTVRVNNKNKRIVLPTQLYNMLLEYKNDTDEVWIEEQWARPGQGVTSMFSFGRTYGTICAVAELVFGEKRIKKVPGRKWKRVYGLTGIKKTAQEQVVYDLDKRGYTGPKPKISCCEAYLIARYGYNDAQIRKKIKLKGKK